MHAREQEKKSPSTSVVRRPGAEPGPADPQHLLTLQRTLGNQAVGAMLGATPPIQRTVTGDWPPAAWATEIQGLNQGNSPLGPDNRGIRQLRQNNAALPPLINQ